MSNLAAGIDIGTNTILMVVLEKNGSNTNIIRDEHNVARLGQDLGKNGYICPEALSRAEKILLSYRESIHDLGVQNIKVVATSAMRDAENALEIKAKLEQALGHSIDIIAGEEEARLSYIGSVDDINSPGAILDIGGGSTELVYSSGHKGSAMHFVPEFRKSLDVGAVRLSEKFFGKLPATTKELKAAETYLKQLLAGLQDIPHETRFYAVAGTPVNLTRIVLGLREYDRSLIHGYTLSVEQIDNVYQELKQMSPQEIIEKFNIDNGRADLMCAGTLILRLYMERFGFGECRVSTYGLRFGAALAAFAK